MISSKWPILQEEIKMVCEDDNGDDTAEQLMCLMQKGPLSRCLQQTKKKKRKNGPGFVCTANFFCAKKLREKNTQNKTKQC